MYMSGLLLLLLLFSSDVDECSEHAFDYRNTSYLPLLFEPLPLTNQSSVCSLNAVCTNTPGSFECECLPGFSGNGFKQCEGGLFYLFILNLSFLRNTPMFTVLQFSCVFL